MEKILAHLENFSAMIAENKPFIDAGVSIRTIADIRKSGFPIISASVPGNTELDMISAGLIDFDPFFGTNIIKMQDYENIHIIYFTLFDNPGSHCSLCLDGIDTIADIYINGTLVKHTENMYISYEIPLYSLKEKDNELIVHIKPAMIEARKYELPAVCNSLDYGYASLYIRKAAHMYGWDIMPRIVSSGLWKPVYIKERKSDRINDAFIYTLSIDKKSSGARISAFCSFDLSEDKTQDYSVVIKGSCGNSRFEGYQKLFASQARLEMDITNCQYWWPRYFGKQNLYSTDITLLYKGNPVDSKHLDIGIRTVELKRTNTTDKNGNGDFCFIINGERIFAMGSNWVPLDPFHSRDSQRLQKAFELLYDVGSNIVRCWGGNVYESDEFYSLCDKYGIMVWQDFAMGCAVYPQEKKFYDLLNEEAIFTIKRLRNHPALILWAGDNEGDYAYMSWGGIIRNPDNNAVTRKVLAKICEAHDFTRPYLPSSPYITEETMRTGADTSEDHLWGPRDYFKGDYYKNTVCHFASETGYHACPSPESVKKFIPENDLWPWYDLSNGEAKKSWLAHAACMELENNAPFAYRIKLMADQVSTLFKDPPENLEDFAKKSQISQGEAVKYYIERFRISKPRRSGIIWWNIIDGWPQFSDAVVDYYFTKKLAYHYIKRSQQPVCLAFDEPENNILSLYALNDTSDNCLFTYKVINLTDDITVISGGGTAFANKSSKVAEIKISEGEKKFYLIEWTMPDGSICRNHYFTNIIGIDFNHYMSCLEKCGFDQFEGF